MLQISFFYILILIDMIKRAGCIHSTLQHYRIRTPILTPLIKFFNSISAEHSPNITEYSQFKLF